MKYFRLRNELVPLEYYGTFVIVLPNYTDSMLKLISCICKKNDEKPRYHNTKFSIRKCVHTFIEHYLRARERIKSESNGAH